MKREINLITDEFVFDPFSRIQPKLLAVWLVILILGFAWEIGSRMVEIKERKAELTQLQNRLAQISKEEQDLTLFIQKNGQMESENFFKEVIKWKEILSVISSTVPEGAWLKNLEGGITQGGGSDGNPQSAFKEIKFVGFANSYAPITLLLSRLERQPLFSQIRLIYTQKGESHEDRAIHFEITGRIN
ncbi:MAG: PilN domain-containing protein [Nitrospirae bacterium]|nr:PilN domain-containing protein [Nitrospirota bacterium]MBI3352364.1 PilN domain-containing protein [Nitrospirota bacterium]